MDPMRKADLMDEIRSKIGVMAEKLDGDIEALYRYVIETLYEHVPAYRYIGIYLTRGYEFVRFHYAGYSSHPPRDPLWTGIAQFDGSPRQTGAGTGRPDGRKCWCPFTRGTI